MRKKRIFGRGDVTDPVESEDIASEPDVEEVTQDSESDTSEEDSPAGFSTEKKFISIPKPSRKVSLATEGLKAAPNVPVVVTNDDALSVMPTRPTLSFMDRPYDMAGVSKKVLAKRKKGSAQTADSMQSVMAEIGKTTGDSKIMLGSDLLNRIIGIPCPFAFQFLLGSRVLPLSIVLHLLAKWGSGKSALVAEIMRWFIALQGRGFMHEVETKFSPFWFQSIIGDLGFSESFAFMEADSVEEWQHNLQLTIENQKLGWKKAKAGMTYPVCYAVDSIMGKLSEEGVTKIESEGSAGRAMPVEAMAIGRYLKTAATWLKSHPFLLILVNHLKDKINAEKGESTRSWSGGGTLGFQETYELELSKGSPINTANASGFHVSLKCYKNSLGIQNRNIFVRVLWWNQMLPGGGFKQVTVWDWDWATVKLLWHLVEGEGRNLSMLRQALKNIGFHLKCPRVGEVENTAWSASLGMREKDAMPWHELGRLIVSDKKLLTSLQDALGLHAFQTFQGDYSKQIAGLKQRMP